MQVENVMFSLIGEVVWDRPGESFEDAVWEELLPSLYLLSKTHDVAHIVAEALDRRGVLNGEYGTKFQKQRMLAVFRCQQLQYELQSLSETLEAAKIPFMPLKGSVLRSAYPQDWMRTSCDIDVLVHREDMDAAIKALTEQKQYRVESVAVCDVSLYAPSGVHLELHHDLVRENRARDAAKLLSHVWDYAKRVAPDRYQYVMYDELFYLYHVAHMAKHFELGGCGVRNFLDLLILDQKASDEMRQKRDEILSEVRLRAFTDCARRLVRVWFEGEEHDDTTRDMTEYVLRSGAYGCFQNRVAVGQVQKGGKLRYLFSRLFLPRDQMYARYPSLNKRKWLLPYYYIKRGSGLILKGRLRVSLLEMRPVARDPVAQAQKLLYKLELIE